MSLARAANVFTLLSLLDQGLVPGQRVLEQEEPAAANEGAEEWKIVLIQSILND